MKRGHHHEAFHHPPACAGKQLYAYLYAMTVIDFDAETVTPEGSADGRAEHRGFEPRQL
mgnify:CR=1 FL=1